jgi:nitrite reductase/ring-hydroxylating ferredoxin subunit
VSGPHFVESGWHDRMWHGGTFRVTDGTSARGPATAPQPVFDTRVTADGALQACLPGAG